MILRELHPAVASRSCDDCQKWQYNEETGEIEQHAGLPVIRLLPDMVPCRVGTCPKGTPEDQRSLSDRNLMAWLHYQECKAVGQFPDDAIVKRNAGIIARAEKAVADHRQRRAEHLQKSLHQELSDVVKLCLTTRGII